MCLNTLAPSGFFALQSFLQGLLSAPWMGANSGEQRPVVGLLESSQNVLQGAVGPARVLGYCLRKNLFRPASCSEHEPTTIIRPCPRPVKLT